MLIEAGASVGFCSYFDAPKTDGSSWKRIISSLEDCAAFGSGWAYASAHAARETNVTRQMRYLSMVPWPPAGAPHFAHPGNDLQGPKPMFGQDLDQGRARFGEGREPAVGTERRREPVARAESRYKSATGTGRPLRRGIIGSASMTLRVKLALSTVALLPVRAGLATE